MKDLIELMPIEKWLELNSKLQQKKNSLRKELKEKGLLKREGNNTYDNYKYFSEAQYKILFTDLFSKYGLEIRPDEEEYGLYEGTSKQPNGRTVKIRFYLIDVDTGFYESTGVTGEGLDKGDKAGYKADTGALKYYLANTFMVATGDDAEKESPEAPVKARNAYPLSDRQIEELKKAYSEDVLKRILKSKGLSDIKWLSQEDYARAMKKAKENDITAREETF